MTRPGRPLVHRSRLGPQSVQGPLGTDDPTARMFRRTPAPARDARWGAMTTFARPVPWLAVWLLPPERPPS